MTTKISSQELLVSPAKFGIEEAKADELIGNLPQIKSERDVLEEQYNSIIKMDIEDPKTAKEAKTLRLKIRDNRTKGIDVWHKTTKDFFLKGGQFVDAIKRMEVAVNVRMEESLESIEKHAEIQEAKRKESLMLERVSELQPYAEFVPMGIDLGSISVDEYSKVLNGAKLQHEAKLEAEAKAEQEKLRVLNIQRLHNERKELAIPFYQFWSEFERTLNFGEQSESDFNAFMERLKAAKAKFDFEQEELRKENERLAQEKLAAEAKVLAEKKEAEKLAAIERQKHELELEKQRKEQAKLQAELLAKKEAELKEKARIEAENAKAKKEAEKLAKAPVKKQLSVWVNSFSIPELVLDNDTKAVIEQKFEAFKKWAVSEIEKI